MREIHCREITEKVAKLCQYANFDLGEDVLLALRNAVEKEESPTGIKVLEQLLANASIACEERVPMCQDTGLAIVFLEVGQNLRIVGGELEEAIHQGVAAGYTEGYLRKSVVSHPLIRKNTNDNTPAIIHTKIVPGNNLKITVAPKGGGSENMSSIRMLPPSAGRQGIINFIVETVRNAGPNPCPPIIVGAGIGGSFEKAAFMAKEALLRPVRTPSPDKDIAALEEEVLEEVNKLGIGPQGFGGRITALAVHINIYPCHIASLPVAVNINCHASRHRSIVL
ncbi:MAG TPA: fumarate hydratase [Clostridia bacterium]|nr:fumarate hydratase [Clostridia bacterium]